MAIQRASWLAVLGIAMWSVGAAAAPLRVLTYNTHGLPPVPPVIPDVSANMTAIAPLLEAVHADGTPTVVALQEVFHDPYYATLTQPSTVTYSTISPKTSDARPPSANAVGDGLTLMTDLALEGSFVHTSWTDCFGSGLSNGGDCEAPKGFEFARLRLSPGVEIDFYVLHADAGQDAGSRSARVANLAQLETAVATGSAGRAVVVLGDTNSLYTRSTDAIGSFASHLGLTDAWVTEALGGAVPGVAAGPNNAGCPPPRGSAASGAGAAGATCELVDKILFRSGTDVKLALLDYDVALDFVDGGAPLSDHLPVAALLDVTLVPEPGVAALVLVGGALLACRRSG